VAVYEESLTTVVSEAQHRVEAVAALVGRRGVLFVLGVDLDQRRVDVQLHQIGARRQPCLL
jgi:hypothetical protein